MDLVLFSGLRRFGIIPPNWVILLDFLKNSGLQFARKHLRLLVLIPVWGCCSTNVPSRCIEAISIKEKDIFETCWYWQCNCENNVVEQPSQLHYRYKCSPVKSVVYYACAGDLCSMSVVTQLVHTGLMVCSGAPWWLNISVQPIC